MRFLGRAFTGLLTVAVCISLIGFGGMRLYKSITEKGDGFQRPNRERVYSVETEILSPQTVTPEIQAFGEVRAWRSLELRASASGPITELSEAFRDGVAVKTGDVLLVIDPTEATRKLAEAEITLEDARNQVTDNIQALELAANEISASEQQLALRKNDLDRQKELAKRGISSQAVVDNAVASLTTAEQALSSKRQAELTIKSRLNSAKLAVRRAELALRDARKDLEDRTIVAPFAGILDQVNGTLGRRVTQNEKLATLIDPTALEVGFKVRDAEFGRLLATGKSAALQPLHVSLTLDLGERNETVTGRIDRAAAVNEAEAGGRTIFAHLDARAGTALRPGDFVAVTVKEEQLENVAVIPAEAATVDGRILLIGEDERIEEITVSILRRQGDHLIIGGAPMGRTYVKTRLPQLATGIKVQQRGPEADNRQPEEPKLISLDDERRTKLIAAVKSNTRIPEDRKAGILKRLSQPKVPVDLVERIESRMGNSRS